MNVTVIVPVKDGARWLAEALDSICAQQDAVDEILVVDDGSADGSMEIAARYDVRIVDGPRAGVAAAYTTGITEARGDAIAFLGQDDLYVPGALRALTDALRRTPDAGLVAGRAELFTDDEPFNGLRTDRLGQQHETRIPESVLIRTEIVRQMLPLANDAAWDLDLFLKLDERGVSCLRVDAPVCRKRLRPDSVIHAGDGQQRQVLTALRESIVRRRSETGT